MLNSDFSAADRALILTEKTAKVYENILRGDGEGSAPQGNLLKLEIMAALLSQESPAAIEQVMMQLVVLISLKNHTSAEEAKRDLLPFFKARIAQYCQ